MEVWRHQRLHRRSAKVYCSGFHVKAMSKHANGALANEELGRCERRKVPAGRDDGRRRFTDLASPPWLNRLQSGYRREGTPKVGSWTRKFGTKLKSLLESLDWRHLAVAAGDAFRDFLSALSTLFLFFLVCYRRVRGDAWISKCCGLDVHLRVWRCIPPASVG